jgi:CRP/FNR family transcriptional regulator, anaerobic regulatory protein
MATRRFNVTIEPGVSAIPFRARSRGRALPLLTDDDASALAAISTIERWPKGAVAYRARSPADSVYNLVQGVVKTYDTRPDKSVSVSGFHFAGDVFGLAEQGQYLESAETVVPAVAFRIPLDRLEALLARDAGLGVRILCKLTDDLRKKHRHAMILSRNDALGKFAMFLSMLEDLSQRSAERDTYFPMMRSDAAQFIGLTLEAMSRTSNALERARVVEFVDRHHFRILDRERFEELLAGTYRPPAGRKRTPRARPKPTPAGRRKRAKT